MESEKNKNVFFEREEMSALAFAIKNRMAIIEMKAIAEHGQTPQEFKKYLDNEWEYKNLLSIARKLEID